jgi:spore germination protein GerM
LNNKFLYLVKMSWEGGNRRFSCFYLVQSNPSGAKVDNNIRLTNEKDQIEFCLIFLFVNPTTATNTLFTLIRLFPLCQ